MKDKILLILKREFFSRVRKRSFIIMSILGPLLIGAIFVIPLWLEKLEREQVKTVAVIDESYILAETLKDTENIRFNVLEDVKLEQIQAEFATSGYHSVLFIPKNVINSRIVQLFSNKQPDFGLKMLISKVIEKDLETLKLVKNNVNPELLMAVRNPIRVMSYKWTADGQEVEASMQIKTIIAMVSAFLIYIFIFMFGTQVMRGVIEEKVNRIVEVIISSVKPIQLMVGKIIGIGAVGLTQFGLWLVLSFSVVSIAQVILFPEVATPTKENPTAQTLGQEIIKDKIKAIGKHEFEYAIDVFDSVRNVSRTVTLGAFLIYFIFGYLLYAAMYAAIGSAIDNETDTQQFMLPVTIPLFLSLLMVQVITYDPDGQIAFWMSMIPLTSPVAMMARIPFGVPIWQFIVSVGILIASFIFVSMLAAKIYRTGILMYGKKPGFKELIKWLKYK